MKIIPLLVIILLMALFSVSLELHPADLAKGIGNAYELAFDAFPPNQDVLSVAVIAMVETIQIAFMGTVLGIVVSLPLSLLASRNLYERRVTSVARTLLAVIRTLPSLLWAVIFVIIVGFGPLAGILAIMMYSVGYIGKLQYEAMEGVEKDKIDAISATGASKLQMIRFAVLPEAANNLISQALFMFEYNVRASSIIGFVGAGGIGFYVLGYLRLLEYDKIATLLIVVLAVVLVIDYVSIRLRDAYLTRKD